jgi:alcohol dehydrogenase (cytochrome c)
LVTTPPATPPAPLPIIAKGKLITGISGGEFGAVGRIDARNPMTGKLIWSRPTVEGHMGYTYDKDGKEIENGISGTLNASWSGDLWKTAAPPPGTALPTIRETNLIFAGTGNPAPWNSHLRPGDNLYSSSTVAIDADTGKIAWHYQNTPHDGWDFDGVNEFVSFDYKDPKTGKIIKAGGRPTVNGFFFVNDRTNGKLLNAFPFVKRSPGQPASTSKPAVRTTSKKAVRATDRQYRWQEGQGRLLGPVLPRRQEPATDGLQPADRSLLCAGQRGGRWTSGTKRFPKEGVRLT